MDSHNFKLEELSVPKAVCLAFHGFYFIVGSLKKTIGDGKIIIGQEPFTVFRKGFGDFLGFNPYLHVLATDGCFYRKGMFRMKQSVPLRWVG